MASKSKCVKYIVPKKVCYLDFQEKGKKCKILATKVLGSTIRDEEVIIDLDPKGRIIGIELVKPEWKPCQGKV